LGFQFFTGLPLTFKILIEKVIRIAIFALYWSYRSAEIILKGDASNVSVP
jgi:hypothetical protein